MFNLSKNIILPLGPKYLNSMGKKFNEFCINKGVVRYYTVMHASCHNGISETCAMTIYMLPNVGLLKEFRET